MNTSEIPTMKSIDQPKKQEKAKKLPNDFECACNTCPSQEACKAVQEDKNLKPNDKCTPEKPIRDLFDSKP